MSEQSTQSSFSKRKTFLLVSSLVVACLIVYFVAIFPWPSAENVSGTIGGAKKADKYQSEQIADGCFGGL